MSLPKNNKIFVLLPDGVGLRNFAYTDFYNLGSSQNLDIVFWNNTPFDLTSLGYKETKIDSSKGNRLTEIYKNARKQIELNLNIKRSGDSVYDNYRFGYSYKTFISAFKSLAVQALALLNSSANGLQKVRKKIKTLERQSEYYQRCVSTLQLEKPDLVFCTNQRPQSAIAPILAAQDLGIPTSTFIFSWDNLPKATMVIETDYYFVWSDLMKQQLISYYPYISEEQIIVTGTPQFETHTDTSLIIPKRNFAAQFKLDPAKEYICYSGDDVTTSPNDPKYLSDVATAVRTLNATGKFNLEIIFRRCPVDFSSRFDSVLSQNQDIIKPIAPLWTKIKEQWNAILPTKEDLTLQMNTIAHSRMVINLGSSMVFDYASFNKPCAFINYDYPIENGIRKNWSVAKVYDFVHFRSMPSQDCVIWLDDAESIAAKIEQALTDGESNVAAAKHWFEKINLHPVDQASARILQGIEQILVSDKI